MTYFFMAFGMLTGSLIRYSISLLAVQMGFALLSPLASLVGCILLGMISAILDHKMDSSLVTLIKGFVKTGVSSGFITFSVFSMEMMSMLLRQQFLSVLIMFFVNGTLCFLGLVLGEYIVNKFLIR